MRRGQQRVQIVVNHLLDDFGGVVGAVGGARLPVGEGFGGEGEGGGDGAEGELVGGGDGEQGAVGVLDVRGLLGWVLVGGGDLDFLGRRVLDCLDFVV